ncbi:MAG TPA: hypothetical protein VFI20_07915 [Terracidiphilus sp.]|nr:hypothetical protein [Terracidiphilus sp.]
MPLCCAPRSSRHLAAILILAFTAIAQGARAQSFDATSLHGPQDLNGTWLVHAGAVARARLAQSASLSIFGQVIQVSGCGLRNCSGPRVLHLRHPRSRRYE